MATRMDDKAILTEEVAYLKERLRKCDGMAEEINILTRENRRLRDFVEDAAHQVGYVRVIDGKTYLTTGGLSTAEEAFLLLDWDDPYLLEEEK